MEIFSIKQFVMSFFLGFMSQSSLGGDICLLVFKESIEFIKGIK